MTRFKISAFFNLSLVFAVLTLLFQNCSPYHAVSHLDSSSLAAKSGAELYKRNCASCHGSLNVSGKSGRTAKEITAAIFSVPQMKTLTELTSLSAEEVSSIALALGAPAPAAGPVYQCVDPTLRGISADEMQRLTSVQIKNTLRDLLGTQIYNDSAVQSALVLLPEDKMMVSVYEMNNTPSSFLPQILLDVSQRVATILTDNSQIRSAVLGSCTSAAINEACVRNVISQFGKKALRRPPTTAEADDYVSFYNALGGGLQGLTLLVARLLQNPALVYHIEKGTIDSGGRTRLSNYELASRISYMAGNTLPDEALFDAAESGELQSLATVRVHVERFLGKTSGVEKLQDFIRYYARLNAEPMPNEFAAQNFGLSASGLGREMQIETFDFVNHIIFTQKGTFKDLMTSKAAFPRSPAMAKILETTPVSATQPVATAVNHPGLLHRPGILASTGGRTSPILRGTHVRKVVLCDPLGDPPDDEVAAREEELGNIDDMPNRDRIDLLTSSSNCVGCHSLLNPLGFTFENYSQLGSRRTIEPIFDAEGKIIKTFPIDTSIEDPKIEAGGATRMMNSMELVAAIADSQKAKACYTKRMFEYYTLRAPDTTQDGCALSETEASTGSRDLRAVLIDSIANEDIFWRKQPQ